MHYFTIGIVSATALIFHSLSSIAAAPAAETERPRELAVELGAPFHAHASLQRGMTAPVWGWSKPGTKVTVEFAGQKKSATAGQDGKWMSFSRPNAYTTTSSRRH